MPFWQHKPVNISISDLFWNNRFPALSQLDAWEIRGRTVITQGKEGWNVSLKWAEYKGSYQIKIQGPFAQGGVTLNGDKTKSVLTMEDGQQIVSTLPDALIVKILNVQLPINALRDWVRGMPYTLKKYESIEYDDEGRITHLIQQNWHIEFKRYVPFKQYSLPSKIFIKHTDQSVRLVILSWDVTTLEQALEWK